MTFARASEQAGAGTREPVREASLQAALDELQRDSRAAPWVTDRGPFLRHTLRRRSGPSREGPAILGLDEWRALIRPVLRTGDAEIRDPSELRRRSLQLVTEFAAAERTLRRFCLAGLAGAWRRAGTGLKDLGEPIALALALLESPQAWIDDVDTAQPTGAPAPIAAGFVSADWSTADDVDRTARAMFRALEPRAAMLGRAWSQLETVPMNASGKLELEAADLALVDTVFESILPGMLRARAGAVPGAVAPAGYRAGQHQVAREIARVLGRDELLLVNAPTGTGKTLAYLVPAMIWSLRNGLRVGVSTYTRALQEQAWAQEVPLALAALTATKAFDAPRVSVLKGRSNYVCWRALRSLEPDDDADALAWLAWVSLVTFVGLHDEADLDHFPARPTLLAGHDAQNELHRCLDALVAGARASGLCCAMRDDRDTCGSELARLRAEKSHVVITNHAFVLSRQGFFRHLIADECEHLHQQAQTAWSHEFSLRDVRHALERLSGRKHRAGASVLGRLVRSFAPAQRSAQPLEDALSLVAAAQSACDRLGSSFEGFKSWREQQRLVREERDLHSLLQEFVERVDELPAAALLLSCHRRLYSALHDLEVALSSIIELCQGELGPQGARRALELARSDIVEFATALSEWLPVDGDPPRFLAETFYDLETDARGEDQMIARVLLPNEYLGRRFLPELASGVLISATTWLRNGFDAALGYLGLDRAAFPAPDEERLGRVVRTFRAPDPFDYSNVVVCVPRDAPNVAAGRDAVLAYVRRFIAFLGERTGGRMLVLFTNSDDLRRVGVELEPVFAAKGIRFWYQGMPGQRKEQLGGLFRASSDAVLMGVDTFWFGADFPGETLEYLVIVRLPYGVPDQYHHAQCAALGSSEQRRRIYLPRALGKFRQGFGRLMRRESDRGAVFLLDKRVLDGRHRFFLGELPLSSPLAGASVEPRHSQGAHLVVSDTDGCIASAMSHMGIADRARELGLAGPFASTQGATSGESEPRVHERPTRARAPRRSPRNQRQLPVEEQGASDGIEF